MAESTEQNVDDRPQVWVGHVIVAADDLADATAFYTGLGMGVVEADDDVAVLEMRGGTHLIVVRGEPAPQAAFDLMVDDLEATHVDWTGRGLPVGEINRVPFHDAFTVTDPAGTAVTVYSSHVVGAV